MLYDNPNASQVSSDFEQIALHLPINGGQVLELGCGAARMTHQVAEQLKPARLIATEVDRIQHEKNLRLTDLPRVEFLLAGAEQIPLDDESVDAVIMLKSLHHVPVELMDQALREITRVLRPGGLAYLSEPIYRGQFNDIMRLFHDEKQVRRAAFEAVEQAVNQGLLQLRQQLFFNSPSEFADFDEFDCRMFQATHTRHQVSPQLRQRIEQAFNRHMTDSGARFFNPTRVDLLEKPRIAKG